MRLQSNVPPESLLGNAANGNGGQNGFYLSEEKDAFLTRVAHSESPNRSTARSLLAIIKGERFVNSLDFDYYQNLAEEAKTERAALMGNPFTVYPNPTKEEISISGFYSKGEEGFAVEIYQITGEKMLHQKVNILQSGTITISLPNLTQGLYFVNIKNGNEVLHSEKLVILK